LLRSPLKVSGGSPRSLPVCSTGAGGCCAITAGGACCGGSICCCAASGGSGGMSTLNSAANSTLYKCTGSSGAPGSAGSLSWISSPCSKTAASTCSWCGVRALDGPSCGVNAAGVAGASGASLGESGEDVSSSFELSESELDSSGCSLKAIGETVMLVDGPAPGVCVGIATEITGVNGGAQNSCSLENGTDD